MRPAPRVGVAAVRNELLTAWLRRPLPVALERTGRLARTALVDRGARAALGAALWRLPRALRARHRLPAAVRSDALPERKR